MQPATPVPQIGLSGLNNIGQSQVGMVGQSQVGMIAQSQVGLVGQSQLVSPGSSQPGVSNSASTTLGQSAAQMAPAQKSKLPLIAGLLMVGIAIAAGGFLWTRAAHKPEPVVAAD